MGLTAIVIAAATLSPLALPHPPQTGPPNISQLIEQAEARARTDLFSARPAYVPEPDGPITTASPPEAVVDAAIVSKTVLWEGEQLPYLVPDKSLPFRYHVERRLAERFGLERVIEAMQQWDNIPGSRWQTEFVSVVDHPEPQPRADGTPVVYLRSICPDHFLGGAFWNSSPARAHIDLRYGAAALFSPQVDISVCPNVDDDRFEGVIAHELGHAMGMAHLCEPGEICWTPEMADDYRRCRPMYFRFGPCREGITPSDHDAARHLYPTLPRLQGPGRAETAARASYATTWTHRAREVVLVRGDHGPLGAAVGAALSGAIDAPLLISEVTDEDCLEEAAAAELSRVAANPGTVLLVGDWPERCADELRRWDLRVEAVEDPDTEPLTAVHAPAVRLSVEAAERVDEAHRETAGAGPERAFLVPADDHPDTLLAIAAAAAAAGRSQVPLLVTDARFLSAPVDRWLAEHPTVREVNVIGRPRQIGIEVVDRLWSMGIVPQRVHARDPATFAANLASREWPVETATRWEHPVVVAPLGSVAEALVGASVAGRIQAPLLLAGVLEDRTVAQWLQRRRPTGGFLVAGTERIPYQVQWAYTTHVRPGDPVPSAAQRDRTDLFAAPDVGE